MTVAEFKDMLAKTVSETAKLQEIRIRVGRPVYLQVNGEEHLLERHADSRFVRELLEAFSNHSLYVYEEEIKQGFLTIEGGHRIGISGKVVMDGNKIRTIKEISGLTIRIAGEWIGCADRVMPWLFQNGDIQNTLFISPPGAGKTTMLRDVIRQLSDGTEYRKGVPVSVVDERSEIGAVIRGIPQFDLGSRTDVMEGCPKSLGMLMMIRSMAPVVIAVDEVGTKEDLEALREVMKCGCHILATVHGACVEDLGKKRILSEMTADGMFERYVVLSAKPIQGTVTAIYDASFRCLMREKKVEMCGI